MQHREIRLNVAGFAVSVVTNSRVQLSGHVKSFLVNEPPEATINVRSNHLGVLADKRYQLAISDHRGWNAYTDPEGSSIVVERPGGSMQVCFASEPRLEVIDVQLRNREESNPGRQGHPEWELSLVEVLPLPVVALLSGRGGLFLHSLAVALEQNGLLFSGVSGSGKSTMANLWRRFGPPNSEVIDDEHILARRIGDSTLLYGAPWCRGPREATPSRAPLKAIFFLAHGAQNVCERMSPSEALAELLSQAFLPLWSREQLELTLQTCTELLQQAACYRLHFVPNQDIIHFVQEVLRDSL